MFIRFISQQLHSFQPDASSQVDWCRLVPQVDPLLVCLPGDDEFDMIIQLEAESRLRLIECLQQAV